MNLLTSKLKPLWMLALAVILLVWAAASIWRSPTGTVRIVINTPLSTRVTAVVKPNKDKGASEKVSAYSAAKEWDQILELPLQTRKIQSIQIKFDGRNSEGSVIKAVSVLDRRGNTVWTAPDTAGSWRVEQEEYLSPLWLLLPAGAAMAVGFAGLVLFIWQGMLGCRRLGRMETTPPVFAGVCIFAFVTMAGVYAAAIEFGRGSQVPSENWIPDLMLQKIVNARTFPSPRTLVVGGSSGLYGIDASLMSRESGQSVINMSVHAGLDLSYHLNNTSAIWQRGDSVVLHLEYNYWDRNGNPSEWQVDQALTWGSRGSSKKQFHYSPIQLLQHVPPSRVIAGLIARANPKAFSSWRPVQVVLPSGETDWITTNAIMSVNNHGDLVSSPSVPVEILSSPMHLNPFEEGSQCKRLLTTFFNDARDAGVELYFAFPATIEGSNNNFREGELKAFMDQLLVWLKGEGVKVLGRPEDTQQPLDRFLDTVKHLKVEGREQHSRKLLKQLREQGWPREAAPVAR